MRSNVALEIEIRIKVISGNIKTRTNARSIPSGS